MKKLILLPGLDGTGLLFQPLLEVLGENIPVQVVHYPPDQCQTVQALAAHVRQQVPFDGETVLLAESFSGLVAMELLREGIPLHSVIFCASFASAPRPWLLQLATILPLALLFRLPLPTVVLRLAGQNSRLIGLLQQVQKQVAPSVLAYRLRLIAAAKPALATQHWQTPCYYLQAAQDWAVPKRCATALRAYFSDVAVNRIEASGHFLLQTQPAACAAIIHAILKIR